MKTKIRTFIGMVALGLIGFTNINATTDYNSGSITNVVTEKEESLPIEAWMLQNEYWTPEVAIDTFESEKAMDVEAWMTNPDLFFKSEPCSALCADRKMGK